MSSPTSVEASPTNALPTSNGRQSGATAPAAAATKRLSSRLFSKLFGDCICDANSALRSFKSAAATDADLAQPHRLYTELDGVECINLGSVEAEQTPAQRVRETIRQISASEATRMISVGHLEEGSYGGHEDEALHVNHPRAQRVGFADANAAEEDTHLSQTAMRVKTKTVPLELYESSYPGDLERSLNRRERAALRHIRAGEYGLAISQLEEVVQDQKRHMGKNDNKYLLGITLHNLGVVRLLEGSNDQQAVELFNEAAETKKEAFGPEHPIVAESLDEIGIQYFAQNKADDALRVFREAKRIRVQALGADHPKVALVDNNIGCVYFQLKKQDEALASFQTAKDILEECMGSEATRSNLDLLHVAATLCNLGYMKFRLKHYEEATAIFEDALLVQQSVLGDNHQAIKDTLSNIGVANAFHA